MKPHNIDKNVKSLGKAADEYLRSHDPAKVDDADDIFTASFNGHIARLALLLAGNPNLINSTDGHGRTPLMLAAKKGHEDAVKFLLEEGADQNLSGIGGWTALAAAAQQGHVGIVQLLLDHKADVNAQTESGYSPLHWATAWMNDEILEMLLSHGADPNLRDGKGRTALALIYPADRRSSPRALILRKYGGRV